MCRPAGRIRSIQRDNDSKAPSMTTSTAMVSSPFTLRKDALLDDSRRPFRNSIGGLCNSSILDTSDLLIDVSAKKLSRWKNSFYNNYQNEIKAIIHKIQTNLTTYTINYSFNIDSHWHYFFCKYITFT